MLDRVTEIERNRERGKKANENNRNDLISIHFWLFRALIFGMAFDFVGKIGFPLKMGKINQQKINFCLEIHAFFHQLLSCLLCFFFTLPQSETERYWCDKKKS